jgi:hypothetical protein
VKYKATRKFWKEFHKLSEKQQSKVLQKFSVFRADPFAPSLGTHAINRLSAIAGHTIYSVVIEANLRVLFRLDQDTITSLDVGTHDLYQ